MVELFSGQTAEVVTRTFAIVVPIVLFALAFVFGLSSEKSSLDRTNICLIAVNGLTMAAILTAMIGGLWGQVAFYEDIQRFDYIRESRLVHTIEEGKLKQYQILEQDTANPGKWRVLEDLRTFSVKDGSVNIALNRSEDSTLLKSSVLEGPEQVANIERLLKMYEDARAPRNDQFYFPGYAKYMVNFGVWTAGLYISLALAFVFGQLGIFVFGQNMRGRTMAGLASRRAITPNA